MAFEAASSFSSHSYCGEPGSQRLVAVDHEKLRIAVAKRVVVLRLRQRKIIVVPVRILLVIADHRKRRNLRHQCRAGLEQVLQPLVLGKSVVDHVAAVQQEIGPLRKGSFGALSRHLGIALRVADHGKRPGHVFGRCGLKRVLLPAQLLPRFVGADHAIEIAGGRLEALERQFADQLRGFCLGLLLQRAQFGIFDAHLGRARRLAHDGDRVGRGELQIGLHQETSNRSRASGPRRSGSRSSWRPSRISSPLSARA